MANNPYSQPTLTGYNATPPGDDGSVSATNQLNWSKHIDKIGDPIKNFATDMDANVLAAFAKTINTDDAEQNSLQGSLAFSSDELTIAAGSVTPDRSHHTIDTEADAATDFLDTITTGSVGDSTVLYLRSANAARVVTVRDSVGNIHLSMNANGSKQIDLSTTLPAAFMRVGTDWYEIAPFRDQITSKSTTATSDPTYELYRDNTAGSNSDRLGRIIFSGNDSGGNKRSYVFINTTIENASTSTTADAKGSIDFFTIEDGVAAERMRLFGSNLGIGTSAATALLQVTASSVDLFAVNGAGVQLSSYTTVGLPTASDYPAGTVVWNTTTNAFNVSTGGVGAEWRQATTATV